MKSPAQTKELVRLYSLSQNNFTYIFFIQPIDELRMMIQCILILNCYNLPETTSEITPATTTIRTKTTEGKT